MVSNSCRQSLHSPHMLSNYLNAYSRTVVDLSSQSVDRCCESSRRRSCYSHEYSFPNLRHFATSLFVATLGFASIGSRFSHFWRNNPISSNCSFTDIDSSLSY